MKIRMAKPQDRVDILKLYQTARRFMRLQGNDAQWGDTDLPEDAVDRDLDRGQLYVGVDRKDRPHYVFYFATGDDPIYRIIEKGQWLNDDPYGSLHRIASDGSQRGVIAEIVQFASEKINNLRCDTHQVNHTMQHALENSGFKACGIIHIPDGTERIAYHRAPK